MGTRTSDGALYEPSIVTGVSVGSTTGNVNLYLPAATTTSSAALGGLVTSQTSTPTATVADVQLSALETISTATYTIPLPPTSTQTSDTLSVETAPSTTTLTCPANTDCAAYTLSLPSGGPYVGAWSSSGATLAATTPLADYMLDGIAYVPSSGGTLNCTPNSEMKSALSTLTGAGPYAVSGINLAFTACQ